MTDLFSQPPQIPSQADEWQDLLRTRMASDFAATVASLRASGIRPPWQLEDFTIQIDEARLMTAVMDHQGLLWGTDETERATTNIIGMTAIGNAKAVVARCYERGLTTYAWDANVNAFRIDLTPYGRGELESWEEDQEGWGYE